MDLRVDSRPPRVRHRALLITTVAVVALVFGALPAQAQTGSRPAPATSAQYRVVGPKTWDDTNKVAQTGAAIDYVEHGQVYVTAIPDEVAGIRALGFDVQFVSAPSTEEPSKSQLDAAAAADF